MLLHVCIIWLIGEVFLSRFHYLEQCDWAKETRARSLKLYPNSLDGLFRRGLVSKSYVSYDITKVLLREQLHDLNFIDIMYFQKQLAKHWKMSMEIEVNLETPGKRKNEKLHILSVKHGEQVCYFTVTIKQFSWQKLEKI